MVKTVKLRDVVKFEKLNGQGSGLPYLGMENISSEDMKLKSDLQIPETTSNTFIFNEKHVLFGRLRPYLRKVFVPNFKGQCSTEIFCLLPINELDRSFLAYWLLHPIISKKIIRTSTGARMPRANMNAILDFKFPLFPISEQKRIVNKIDTAFAEIDNLLDLNKQQKNDFKKLCFKVTNSFFTNKTKDEKSVYFLKDICDFENGDRGKNYPSKKFQVQKGIPFVNAGDFSNDGEILLDKMAFISGERFNLLGSGKFKMNDILFCLRGSLGKCAINKTIKFGAIASSLVILRAKENFILADYLFAFLRSSFIKNKINETQSGTAQPNLSLKVVSQYPVFVPSLDMQKNIVEKYLFVKEQQILGRKKFMLKDQYLKELKSCLLSQEIQSEDL